MLGNCKECGSLIDSRDGEKCDWCKAAAGADVRGKTQKVMDEVIKSLGLVKVKGNLGGTYWE
jgi:hypothetical protein